MIEREQPKAPDLMRMLRDLIGAKIDLAQCWHSSLSSGTEQEKVIVKSWDRGRATGLIEAANILYAAFDQAGIPDRREFGPGVGYGPPLDGEPESVRDRLEKRAGQDRG